MATSTLMMTISNPAAAGGLGVMYKVNPDSEILPTSSRSPNSSYAPQQPPPALLLSPAHIRTMNSDQLCSAVLLSQIPQAISPCSSINQQSNNNPPGNSPCPCINHHQQQQPNSSAEDDTGNTSSETDSGGHRRRPSFAQQQQKRPGARQHRRSTPSQVNGDKWAGGAFSNSPTPDKIPSPNKLFGSSPPSPSLREEGEDSGLPSTPPRSPFLFRGGTSPPPPPSVDLTSGLRQLLRIQSEPQVVPQRSQ